MLQIECGELVPLRCVVPNKFGIAVFSPRLDENGNSVRGVQTLHEFIRRFNFHQYDTLKGVLTDGPNAVTKF